MFQTQTAVFQCATQLAQAVAWLKNNSPVVPDARMVVLPSGALEVTNVNIGDRGSYACRVAGTTSSPATLTLKALPESTAPEPPAFLVTPSSQSVLLGEEVTLECAANGVPQPTVSWLKDGRELDTGADPRFERAGHGSLTIGRVELADEGGYQCRAENSEDSVDAGIELAVLVAPTLTKAPKSQVSYEKDDVLFECSVHGRPEPSVKWYKNGDLIIQSEYFQVGRSPTNPRKLTPDTQMVRGTSLRILGLVSSDSGVYQCIAANTAGTIQAAAQLRVQTKGDSHRNMLGGCTSENTSISMTKVHHPCSAPLQPRMIVKANFYSNCLTQSFGCTRTEGFILD